MLEGLAKVIGELRSISTDGETRSRKKKSIENLDKQIVSLERITRVTRNYRYDCLGTFHNQIKKRSIANNADFHEFLGEVVDIQISLEGLIPEILKLNRSGFRVNETAINLFNTRFDYVEELRSHSESSPKSLKPAIAQFNELLSSYSLFLESIENQLLKLRKERQELNK